MNIKDGKVRHGLFYNEPTGFFEYNFAVHDKGERCQVVRCQNKRKTGRRVCACHYQRRWRINQPELNAYRTIKDRAARQGKPFNLSLEVFLQLCRDHNFHELQGTGNDDLQLDRIDARRGYEDDNVQILTGLENRVKAHRLGEKGVNAELGEYDVEAMEGVEIPF